MSQPSHVGLSKVSILNKTIMALTGLFLCVFLLGHLSGNLQLLIPGEAGRLQFNEYAKFMTSNPFIKLISYLTYFSLLYHAFKGIALSIKNRGARNHNYAHNRPAENSMWSSRNMGILGTLILAFLILHMSNFWARYHWGEIGIDSVGNKDLHQVVVHQFKQWWYVLIYVVLMIPIGFHLLHGFRSGFQSFGLNHPKYNPIIKLVSWFFGLIIPLAFATIPVYVYLFIS